MIEYGSPEYRKLELELLKGYAPGTYPCKKCGHPVVDGYCCHGCGDSAPYDPK